MRYRSDLYLKFIMMYFIVFLTILASSLASAAEKKDAIGGLSPEEALKAGRKIYYQGILPSGKPLIGIVHGDLEITGDQSPCSSCHLYSGLGSFEGGVLTTPTNGAKLYAPLSTMMDIPGPYMNRAMFQYKRPAYTDETLAKALIDGVSPSGRILLETMPRYLMDKDETDILIYFLKNLSSTISPGVNEKEIRFSIIVSDKIPREERDAMIQPLQSFFKNDWNGRMEYLQRQWNARWLGGETPKGLRYREAVLDVWELTGPEEGWGKQLEKYYTDKPVFAVLGGKVSGKWEPVHRFCESSKIPCIFPQTDLPVVSSTDWYTLYFSKGYYQEGEAAAKYLSRVVSLPEGTKVVQVYRENEKGTTLARGFAESWEKLGDAPLKERKLSAADKIAPGFWKELAADNPGAVLLVWLDQADLSNVETVLEPAKRPSMLFFSSTLLSRELESIPDSMREITFFTYPTRLPGEEKYSESIFTGWMTMKKLPITNADVSSKIYFLTRIIFNAMADMGSDFYREFFMDILDCGKDQPTSSVAYPMLSFGPGQRYASKGCYVVSITKGKNAKVIRQSEWVIF